MVGAMSLITPLNATDSNLSRDWAETEPNQWWVGERLASERIQLQDSEPSIKMLILWFCDCMSSSNSQQPLASELCLEPGEEWGVGPLTRRP